MAVASRSSLQAIPISSMILYVASYAIGLGPMVWLVLSEIYPTEVRAEAIGIATFANWATNVLVSLTFLSLSHWIGEGSVFLFYALICGATFYFVYRRLPETKEKTFKQIEALWRSN